MSDFNKEYYDEKLKGLEEDSKEHNKRLNELEKIYITIEKLALEMTELRKDYNEMNKKITAIEKEPADKWKNITNYVLTTIVGAVIGYILVKLGLK